MRKYNCRPSHLVFSVYYRCVYTSRRNFKVKCLVACVGNERTFLPMFQMKSRGVDRYPWGINCTASFPKLSPVGFFVWWCENTLLKCCPPLYLQAPSLSETMRFLYSLCTLGGENSFSSTLWDDLHDCHCLILVAANKIFQPSYIIIMSMYYSCK